MQLNGVTIVNDVLFIFIFQIMLEVFFFSFLFSSSPSPLRPGTWRSNRSVSDLIKQLHTFNIFIRVEAPGEGRNRRRLREEGEVGCCYDL